MPQIPDFRCVTRVHGTTRKQVGKLFREEEKSRLLHFYQIKDRARNSSTKEADTVTRCPYGGSTRLLIGTGDSPYIDLWYGLIDDVRVYRCRHDSNMCG